jgi:hypothetical protein
MVGVTKKREKNEEKTTKNDNKDEKKWFF